MNFIAIFHSIFSIVIADVITNCGVKSKKSVEAKEIMSKSKSAFSCLRFKKRKSLNGRVEKKIGTERKYQISLRETDTDRVLYYFCKWQQL